MSELPRSEHEASESRKLYPVFDRGILFSMPLRERLAYILDSFEGVSSSILDTTRMPNGVKHAFEELGSEFVLRGVKDGRYQIEVDGSVYTPTEVLDLLRQKQKHYDPRKMRNIPVLTEEFGITPPSNKKKPEDLSNITTLTDEVDFEPTRTLVSDTTGVGPSPSAEDHNEKQSTKVRNRVREEFLVQKERDRGKKEARENVQNAAYLQALQKIPGYKEVHLRDDGAFEVKRQGGVVVRTLAEVREVIREHYGEVPTVPAETTASLDTFADTVPGELPEVALNKKHNEGIDESVPDPASPSLVMKDPLAAHTAEIKMNVDGTDTISTPLSGHNAKDIGEKPHSFEEGRGEGMSPSGGDKEQYDLDFGDDKNVPPENGKLSGDPYWSALNQHISPENYAKYGIEPTETDDAYWRAQKLTISPEWVTTSHEDLLKEFEKSRQGEETSLSDTDPGAPSNQPETPPGGASVGVSSVPSGPSETTHPESSGEVVPSESEVHDTQNNTPRKRFEGGMKRPEVMERLRNASSADGVDGERAAAPDRGGDMARLAGLRSRIDMLTQADADAAYTSTALLNAFPGLKAAYNGQEFAGRFLNGNEAGALMWVRNEIDRLKNEVKTLESRTGDVVDARYGKFGISRENLETLPGFKELTEGQRLLLCENLIDYAERGPNDNFVANVWRGMLASRLGIKGESIPKKGTRGFDAYKNQLVLLIEGMKGLRVHVEDGEALPDFVGVELSRRFRAEQKAVLDALNHFAHAHAKIPASWQEKKSSTALGKFPRLQEGFARFNRAVTDKVFGVPAHVQYEESLQDFEDAKRRFAEIMHETGHDHEDIVRALITVDANVHAQRFIETNQEAVALLKESVDPKTAEGIGTRLVSGGVYAGLGVLSKRAVGETASMAVDTLSWVGGPLVAAGLAGTKKWNEEANKQRQRDLSERWESPEEEKKYKTLLMRMKNAYARDPHRAHNERVQNDDEKLPWSDEYRMAVTDLKDFEKTIISRGVVSAVEKREDGVEKGLIAKLNKAVSEYEQYKDSTVRIARGGFVNVNGISVRERARTKGEVVREHLVARVAYVEDKLRRNYIDFGDKGDYAVNKVEFIEAYIRAKVIVSNPELTLGKNTLVTERLKRLLDTKEDTLSARRTLAQFHAMKHRDVLMAGALGGLGATLQLLGVVDYVQGKMAPGLEKVRDVFSQLSEKVEKAMEPSVSYGESSPLIENGATPPAPTPGDTVPSPKPAESTSTLGESEEKAPVPSPVEVPAPTPSQTPDVAQGEIVSPRIEGGLPQNEGASPQSTSEPRERLGENAVRISAGLESGIPAREWEQVRGKKMSEIFRAHDLPQKRVIPGVSGNVINGLVDIARNESIEDLVAPKKGETVDQFMGRLTRALSNISSDKLTPELRALLDTYPFLEASLRVSEETGLQPPVSSVPEVPRVQEFIQPPPSDTVILRPYIGGLPGGGRMSFEFDYDVKQNRLYGVRVNGDALTITNIVPQKNGELLTLVDSRGTVHQLFKPSMYDQMSRGLRYKFIPNGGRAMELFRPGSNRMP